VGRISNRNCREKEQNMEKELGIQTTMEEVFKKDGKGGKAPSTKGSSSVPSHPSKGGHQINK
jgi:hypothetical protein